MENLHYNLKHNEGTRMLALSGEPPHDSCASGLFARGPWIYLIQWTASLRFLSGKLIPAVFGLDKYSYYFEVTTAL